MAPFGTWNEIVLVVCLASLIVIGTKVAAIGNFVGAYFAKKD